MPLPAKSLFGFLTQDAAVNYLKQFCVLPNAPTDPQLIAMWTAARGKLGAPTTNAGLPSIQPIPASHSGYITQLLSQPWMMPHLSAGFQFALVEIEPLLAYQTHIGINQSAHHCAPFSNPPTLDELLTTCLPITLPNEPAQVSALQQSVLIRSKSLNFRGLGTGLIAQNAAGLAFGMALPFAHVVRFNGKCYLHNGFHRAYGAALAGATHIPCVFRDVATQLDAGILDDGGTFSLALLESADPPTLKHFIDGRAEDVPVRIFSRALHISWAEYAVAEE